MNTKTIVAAFVILAAVSSLVLINNYQTISFPTADGKVKVDLYS